MLFLAPNYLCKKAHGEIKRPGITSSHNDCDSRLCSTPSLDQMWYSESMKMHLQYRRSSKKGMVLVLMTRVLSFTQNWLSIELLLCQHLIADSNEYPQTVRDLQGLCLTKFYGEARIQQFTLFLHCLNSKCNLTASLQEKSSRKKQNLRAHQKVRHQVEFQNGGYFCSNIQQSLQADLETVEDGTLGSRTKFGSTFNNSQSNSIPGA